MTKEIAYFKSIEKLKQWISIHLSEELFFEELKTKRFKKRNDLIPESKLNNDQSNNLMDISLEKLTLNLSDDMPSDLFNQLKVIFVYFFTFVVVENLKKLFSYLQKLLLKKIAISKRDDDTVGDWIIEEFKKMLKFLKLNVKLK